MKLYTKRGDAGQTDLYGGQRVEKNHPRVEAYGTVDELNSFIGVALAAAHQGAAQDARQHTDPKANQENAELADALRSIQSRLFEIGADLATPRHQTPPDSQTPPDNQAPPDNQTPSDGRVPSDNQVAPDGQTPSGGQASRRGSAVPRVGPQQVEELEHWIDAMCQATPPMQHFVLPGGTELAARLHVARTVCRRAERLCVTLARCEPLGEHVVTYLNRLSDLLFAMARRANQIAGVDDVPWSGRR